MWYSQQVKSETVEYWTRFAMVKQASAVDELWKTLNDAGITDRIGTPDRKSFEQLMMQKDPRFAQSIGQHASSIQDEKQQTAIQQAYSNFVSGRILAEEISKARQQAALQGREPSVAELRAARHNANQRLENEGIFDEGLGMPSQISIGRRGPLGKIKLKPISVAPEKIKDEKTMAMANQILEEEKQKAKIDAMQRFYNGQSDSPEPTAADLRAATIRANERLTEGLKFQVGTRGPLPNKFELNRNIQNSKEYYEWKKRQHMKDNLGLADALPGVEPGNVVIPGPPNMADTLSPEEMAVKEREQQQFDNNKRTIIQQFYADEPPVHDDCRCRIVEEGQTYKWQTAGDAAVCPECKKKSMEFNGLRNV